MIDDEKSFDIIAWHLNSLTLQLMLLQVNQLKISVTIERFKTVFDSQNQFSFFVINIKLASYSRFHFDFSVLNSVSNSKRLLRVIIIAMLCSSYLEEYNLISHHESDLLIILISVWRLHSSTSLSRFFQETSLTVSFALSQFSAHTILWLYFFDFCKWVLAWFSA